MSDGHDRKSRPRLLTQGRLAASPGPAPDPRGPALPPSPPDPPRRPRPGSDGLPRGDERDVLAAFGGADPRVHGQRRGLVRPRPPRQAPPTAAPTTLSPAHNPAPVIPTAPGPSHSPCPAPRPGLAPMPGPAPSRDVTATPDPAGTRPGPMPSRRAVRCWCRTWLAMSSTLWASRSTASAASSRGSRPHGQEVRSARGRGIRGEGM